MSDLIDGGINIKDLPRVTMISMYAQLKEFSQIWQDIEALDGRVLAEITPKVKKSLKMN